jgi:hypothetical protein
MRYGPTGLPPKFISTAMGLSWLSQRRYDTALCSESLASILQIRRDRCHATTGTAGRDTPQFI